MTIKDYGLVHDTERAELEKQFGKTWNTQELQSEFIVHGFSAPFISVTRKADNVKGHMEFQHNPRYYFGFTAS